MDVPGSPEANGKLPVSRSNLLAGGIRGQTAFAVEATMTRERLEVGCDVGVVVPCPDGHVMTGLALPMVSAGNKLPPTCSICNALAAQVEHSAAVFEHGACCCPTRPALRPNQPAQTTWRIDVKSRLQSLVTPPLRSNINSVQLIVAA